MKSVPCPNCHKDNDVTQNYCFFCGASLDSTSMTSPLPEDAVNRGPAVTRWGRLPFDQDNTFELQIPNHHTPLYVALDEGQQVVLGRGAPKGGQSQSASDTITIASKEMRAQLLEAVHGGMANPVSKGKGKLPEPPPDDPDFIDLNAYGAAQAGVSRKHAILERTENFLMVTPLQTTNGTRLNGAVLGAGQRRVVRDHDELQLGSLVLRVNFRAAGGVS